MNDKALAEDIFKLLGGKHNVAALQHCATRLRFDIIDNQKVNLTRLKALDGVIAVFNHAGVLQVVPGDRVAEIFAALTTLNEDNTGLTTHVQMSYSKTKRAVITLVMYGVLALPIFFGEIFIGFTLGCTFAFIGSLVLALIAGFDEPFILKAHTVPTPGDNNELALKSTMPKKAFIPPEQIAAPATGTLIPLMDVDDNVFSTGIVGPGFAILPDEGRIYSPVDGHIVSTFASGHAIGIISEAGTSILIHVGINTVQLDGRYFQMKVKEGDAVKKGELLLTFDLANVKLAGYDTAIPVIVTNSRGCQTLPIYAKKYLHSGDAVIALSL
ncbi:glucose PTS transporter subunit IIA [Salmonella enterica]